MKRRNFIGTLAAAITAAGIGIVASKPKGQLELFAEFFEKRNGFKMNGFQIAAYISYEKGQRFYFPPGHGMTTLFHTIASHESNENNKSSLLVIEGWLLERHNNELKLCWYKDVKSFLCGKSYDIILYDVGSGDKRAEQTFPLTYYAETVASRAGVIKKRFPNYNV